MRTSIYIDGFNLYYRALKGTPYKWLDLKQLAVNLLQPHHVITEIKYFTAIVSGIFDPSLPIRQKTYIRALKSYLPDFSVYYGHFLSHEVSCLIAPLTRPPHFISLLLHGHPSRELQKHGHFVKRIREGVLRISQLPSPIPGTTIHKPAVW